VKTGKDAKKENDGFGRGVLGGFHFELLTTGRGGSRREILIYD